jgi:PAS domain S-box-containing protein
MEEKKSNSENLGQKVKEVMRKTQGVLDVVEALKAPETHYRRLFEAAEDGILILDTDTGEVTDVNPFLIKMLGYPYADIVGKKLWEIGPFKDREESKAVFQELQRKGYVRYEDLPLETNDGQSIAVEFVSNVYSVNDTRVIQCNIRNITARKQAEDALRKAKDELEELVKNRTQDLMNTNQALELEIEAHKLAEKHLRDSEQELQQLSSRLIIAQEEERKRVAMELHDEISSKLAGVKFGMEKRLIQKPAPSDQERITLEDTINTLKDTMTSIRSIMVNLRPAMIDDLGLLPTINWYCREFQKIYDAPTIEKEFDIEEEEIPDHLKIVIFRIIQEAMNNVVKHSQADQMRLSLKRKQGAIELLVEDNGLGFNVVKGNTDHGGYQGMGLTGIKERIRHSGGTISIESLKGKGTVIQVTWPDAT